MSCVAKNDEIQVSDINKYSQSFIITETNDGYDVLTVKNSKTFHLSREKSEGAITIPIKSAVCFSTTYSAFITQLDELGTIKGIGGTQYVCDTSVIAKIKKGEIVEVGFDKQLDLEKIISLKPDVVFAYGVDNESMSGFLKLEKIGINVVVVDDYLESKPLGRTEWIKFFGCFYDKYDEAEHYFDSVENRYSEIKELSSEQQPKVLVSLPWKGTWWVPGGNSFFANFVRDAGGKYIFDNDETDSQPYTIERVFAEAAEAEIWLHPYEKTQRMQILDVDSRLENFAPYKKAKIFNNNKITNAGGGSDFWESGIVHPDIVLSDLSKIFSGRADSLVYYIELK